LKNSDLQVKWLILQPEREAGRFWEIKDILSGCNSFFAQKLCGPLSDVIFSPVTGIFTATFRASITLRHYMFTGLPTASAAEATGTITSSRS